MFGKQRAYLNIIILSFIHVNHGWLNEFTLGRKRTRQWYLSLLATRRRVQLRNRYASQTHQC